MIESWRHVWRNGIAPLLSRNALTALKEALETDDPRLVQGCTTVPPPLACVSDWPVEGACAIGYCGWMGEGLATVAETEEYFARLCYAIDQKMGEPAACRWWLNWWDEEPRQTVRLAALAEVCLALANRDAQEYAA